MPIVVLVMVLTIVIGCAPAAPTTTPAKPAVSEAQKPKEFVLWATQDLSGPMATGTLPNTAAMNDLVKWVNDNGGIDGVMIRAEIIDTRYESSLALSAYSKIRESVPRPAIYVCGIGRDALALKDRIAEDKIPTIVSSPITDAIWPPSWIFSFSPSWADLTGGYLDWLSNEWAKTGQSRACRLAIFNANMAAAQEMQGAEVLEYVKTKKNIEIVATELYDPKSLDLSSEMLKLSQANPDYMYGYYHPGTGAAAVFKSYSTSPLAGKTKISTVLWGLNSEIAMVVDPKMLEGVKGPHVLPPLLPGKTQVSKGMEWVANLFDANPSNPPQYRGGGYTSAILVFGIALNALEQTVKEVGWAKVDGEAVYRTLENTTRSNIHDIAVWGHSKGTRTSNQYQIMEWKNGVPMPAGEWTTAPDMRPAKFRTAEYGWSSQGWAK